MRFSAVRGVRETGGCKRYRLMKSDCGKLFISQCRDLQVAATAPDVRPIKVSALFDRQYSNGPSGLQRPLFISVQ